jgi:hypothetical protein
VRRASQTSSIAPPVGKDVRDEYYYNESSFFGRLNKKFGQSKVSASRATADSRLFIF